MAEFTLLNIVHAVMSNGKIKITMNVLFDYASTKTYINSDVAEQMKLKGYQIKIGDVLNNQVKIFGTVPV